MLVATAARPAPGEPVSEAGILMSGKVSRQLEVGGGVVSVTSKNQRQVFARAEESNSSTTGYTVHLGRLLWAQLGARPGETVQVAHVEAPPATEVIVQAAFHVPERKAQRVIHGMRASAAVVWPGARLFFPMPTGDSSIVVGVASTSDSPAVVVDETVIEFGPVDPDIGRRPVSLSDVGGLDDQISRLRELIELPLLRPEIYRSLGIQAPKGVLLHGPPGTGKTLISRAMAAELGANVVRLPATHLVGGSSGETETNIRDVFSDAAHFAPTLIVVDEIDVIAANRARLASQSDIRAASQLLMVMDGLVEIEGVLVLATTNRIEAIDEAFRRPGRFDEELYIGPPSAEARREIVSLHAREMPLSVAAEASLTEAADNYTAGYTGADLMRLVREVGLAASRRLTKTLSDGFEGKESISSQNIEICSADVWTALQSVDASVFRGIPTPPVILEWESFSGLDGIRRELLRVAKNVLARQGADLGGILLGGPPGTGKTSLALALAQRLRVRPVVMDGSTIFTQWLGESEAALRAFFRKAMQASPSILIVESVETLAPTRNSGPGEAISGRVLSSLLSSVDEAVADGVLVIGVTSRPDLIDEALLRPGRLGVHLQVPLPDAARRRLIARAEAGDVSDATIEKVVVGTDGLSAAHVQQAARRMASVEKGRFENWEGRGTE